MLPPFLIKELIKTQNMTHLRLIYFIFIFLLALYLYGITAFKLCAIFQFTRYREHYLFFLESISKPNPGY